MPDNFAFTEGSGKSGAADEISEVLYPRIKLIHGADGVNDGDVSSANPLPVNAVGSVAHDSADSGNPVKVGGKAVNMDGTEPGTAVAEGDRTNLITDTYGRLLVDNVHPCFFSASYDFDSAQTNTELVAAPGEGKSIYITDIIISNGATAGTVKLVKDTGGTPVDVLENQYLAINGDRVIHLRTPIKLTANKNLGVTSATCTTHSVTVNGHIGS